MKSVCSYLVYCLRFLCKQPSTECFYYSELKLALQSVSVILHVYIFSDRETESFADNILIPSKMRKTWNITSKSFSILFKAVLMEWSWTELLLYVWCTCINEPYRRYHRSDTVKNNAPICVFIITYQTSMCFDAGLKRTYGYYQNDYYIYYIKVLFNQHWKAFVLI